MAPEAQDVLFTPSLLATEVDVMMEVSAEKPSTRSLGDPLFEMVVVSTRSNTAPSMPQSLVAAPCAAKPAIATL